MATQNTIIQEKTLSRSSIFTTGLALFSMFFGAGNLIFPLLIGKAVGSNTWYAILGLSITAVVIPFLGLASMVLFQADYTRFFSRLGKIPGMMLLLIVQLILGPLGVIPRLITLMYAMARPYLFNLPIITFSIIIAALIFLCTFKKEYLVKLLGAWLTPLLLISLMALIGLGLLQTSSPSPIHMESSKSFLLGLTEGYNTMDLLAAFLFATVILPHFQLETYGNNTKQRQRSIIKKMFFSSLIAASLLFLTYVGLAWLAANHAWSLNTSLAPDALLGAIAHKILGPIGGLIATFTVIIACLTTAITLSSIFSDYLRKDLCKNRISSLFALSITLVVTSFFATLGFEGIAAFLSPILQVIYPGLIVFTILNLFHHLYGWSMVKTPVFLMFGWGTYLICI